MLGKAIKYDILAQYKSFCVVYAGIIISSIFFRILDSFSDNLGRVGKVMSSVIGSIFTILVIASIFMVFILAVTRFYKNLMRDEGYLTHTLPMPTWQLILSKLITAYIFTIATIIILGFAFGIFSGEYLWLFELIEQSSYIKSEMIAEAGPGIIPLIRIGLIYAVLAPFTFLSQVYFSFSIGNLSNKNKLGFSILTYFGVNCVNQILGFIFISIGAFNSNLITNSVYTATDDKAVLSELSSIFNGYMILFLLVPIALYILANYIFTKKLNLE